MTRAECHERRGILLGTLAGVLATCLGGAAWALCSVIPEEALYLVLVGALAGAASALAAGSAWVTWTALAWARGEQRR